MTYFGFLFRFLVIPIVIVAALLWLDRRRGIGLPDQLRNYAYGWVIFAHIVIAVTYTTPWDNYLVATNVWWYDESLVTGILIGYVPIEEYTFFVLQTLLSGMVVVFLARRQWFIPKEPFEPWRGRWPVTAAVFVGWIASFFLLFSNYQPGTYLALELTWALFPILIQLVFGADILWHYRRLVAVPLIGMTLFLSFGDALAINSGTWTIDPAQSLQIYLGGVLPIEELIFFILTNTLVVFGVTLVCSRISQARLDGWLATYRQRRMLSTKA